LAQKINVENVKDEHQEEMRAASMKRYREHNFSPGDAGAVKSIRVSDNWDRDGGMLEKTSLTFHSHPNPTHTNIFGPPVTLNRALTLQLHKVPASARESVDKDVRALHAKMAADPQHPAAKSNYGVVHTNFHDSVADVSHNHVIVGFEEVPEAENKRKPVGEYAVRIGAADHALGSGPSSHTG
jgi:hypothetical protein